MEVVFLKLLNMSIAAGWLVLAVVVLRVLLQKAPKAIRCILWALVGIRLISPFTFESVFSLIPSAETVPEDIMYAQEPVIHSGVSTLNSIVNPVLSESMAPTVGDSVDPMQVVTIVCANLWVVGMIAMVIYAFVSFLRIHKRVAVSMPLRDNIYLCDYIGSPFILGVIRPKIYLPSTLEEAHMFYVIAHEKAHLERRDHWWKPLGFALLTVYWFHPLIWLAYILLCRDIELACDERVIRRLGEPDKKSYSHALLSCSISRKMVTACPLAFGEVGVKERVRSVLHYKKPAFWIVVVAGIACIVVAVCFLTNPKEKLLHAPEPFCHSYYVEEILYDAPEFNFAYSLDTAPQYSFSSDYVMMQRGGIGLEESSKEWVSLGSLQEVKLTRNHFDKYFKEVDGISGWCNPDNLSAAKLRNDNVAAWELIAEEGEGVLSYYLLLQENGDVYLVCWYYDTEHESDSEVRWLFKLARTDYISYGEREDVFPTEVERAIPVGNYTTLSCLYMNPLSSWAAVNGDSGCTYYVEEDAFIIKNRNYEGEGLELKVSSWVWQKFPYTDEEWSGLFVGIGEMGNISGLYEEMLYLPLAEEYSLMKMDGELWLVKMNESPDGTEYIWDIYILVQEGSMGAAWLQLNPLLSSGYPGCPIEFAIEGAEVTAFCTYGKLGDYDSGDYETEMNLTVPSSHKLYWLPYTMFAGETTLVTTAELHFTITLEDDTTLSGRIDITREESTDEAVVYRANLVAGDLIMMQNEEQGGAVIERVGQSSGFTAEEAVP